MLENVVHQEAPEQGFRRIKMDKHSVAPSAYIHKIFTKVGQSRRKTAQSGHTVWRTIKDLKRLGRAIRRDARRRGGVEQKLTKVFHLGLQFFYSKNKEEED